MDIKMGKAATAIDSNMICVRERNLLVRTVRKRKQQNSG